MTYKEKIDNSVPHSLKTMIVIDFLILFLTCLALALFSLENTQEIAIKILPQLEIQVHLAVALIVSLGIGATLTGLYITWVKIRTRLQFRSQARQIKEREQQIQQLKEDMKSRQAELELLRQEKENFSSEFESVDSNEDIVNDREQSDNTSLVTPVEAN
ncbi:MAG: LapA family protein [Pleurocapsa sp. MO_226.B13]|nr:LapA family protein [Pleurocapsa sp. MO_226.B13]